MNTAAAITLPVLQTSIPYDVHAPRKLPGIQPFDMKDWLIRDDAFAGQMAERDHLLRHQRKAVIAMDDTARPAALELLDLVLEQAYGGATGTVQRPDGVSVDIDRTDPMGTLGRLIQEDLCVLQKRGDEHVLTAAALCFPASWTLSEKFMRPLIAIHVPVDSYDGAMAARVQRLFDGVQVGRPLWRFNALWYDSAALHHPLREGQGRSTTPIEDRDFLRSERQCILRLPETRAVVFSIHTFLLHRKTVEADMQNAPA